MKFVTSIIILLTISFLASCGSKSASTSSSISTNSETKTMKTENAIVFLFLTIEKETNGNEVVKLTEKKITEGTIKNASLENHENVPGNIRVAFLGKDGKEISERFVENPLNPMMEVYTEEGINKEKMTLQKADFSVRFNQTGDTKSVILEKISSNSKKHLITIQL